jgi:NADPH2:quinone reductase
MKAIRVSQNGGPEMLKYEDLPTPEPKAGEVLVKLTATGVNFIEIYHRLGRYPMPLPFIPGSEGVGVVESAAAGVEGFKKGDRVGFVGVNGSYAEYISAPAARLIPLPKNIDDHSAAAAMLQGMTVHYLVLDTFPIKQGHTVLIHAAAGGVGLLLTQTAKRLGARIIATVSTEAKAKLAREAGADEVILYTQKDFVSETKRLTNNAGVDVVYDAVGKDTFENSMNCLRQRGMMVLYGSASGLAPMVDPNSLGAQRGSLFLTRPLLFHHIADRESLLRRANDVFNWVASGEMKLKIHGTYKLADASQAHRDLEGRLTTGKLLLLP